MAKSIFKTIDENIFKSIDNFKDSPQFIQFTNTIEGLPEAIQKGVNQGLTYLITFIPIVGLLIFLYSNWTQRSDLREKEELIESISRLTHLKRKSVQVSNSIVGPTPMNDQPTLIALLSRVGANVGINNNQIKTSDFKTEAIGELVKMTAKLSLSELTTPKLFNFINQLVIGNKFKVSNLQIIKTKNKLKINLSILHFGKKTTDIINNENEE